MIPEGLKQYSSVEFVLVRCAGILSPVIHLQLDRTGQLRFKQSFPDCVRGSWTDVYESGRLDLIL